MTFQQFQDYTARVYQRDQDFDSTQTDRHARHRHLEPVSAQFLASLVIGKSANAVLEIGTSTGYSTLWLAYALDCLAAKKPTNFISLDVDSKRLATAKQHLQNLQLAQLVQLHQADAKAFLAQSTNPYDLIFLDAERQFYGEYVADLKRLLSVSAILIVDNVISHAPEVTEFLAQFEHEPAFLCTTLPIGAGLFMAVRQP